MFVMLNSDTDGFVIPSLGIGDSDQSKRDAVEVESSKPPSPKVSACSISLFLKYRGKRKS